MNNCYFIKDNVLPREFTIHSMIIKANIVNTPQIYKYDKTSMQLKMRNIPEMSVSDMYGEDFENVPSEIIDKIRDVIAVLYRYGIEYPDITGYNFIYYQNKIWIFDFGHASFNLDKSLYDPFILEFINGRNDWNPNYK